MLFIRYENWKSYLKYYPITSLLLAANIVMFLLFVIKGRTVGTALQYGALTNMEPFASEWWRTFTAMFLHADFGHLLSNCFGLLVFAPPMERILGWWKYAILYAGSGIVGNIMTLGWYQQSAEFHMSIGASGAIYGIYGAFLYIALFQRYIMDEGSRKILYTLLVIGIVFSFMIASINWMGHIGGLIAGFFIYGLMIRLFKRRY